MTAIEEIRKLNLEIAKAQARIRELQEIILRRLRKAKEGQGQPAPDPLTHETTEQHGKQYTN